MTDPTSRVCPRCGSEAGEHEYCQTCGLHLTEQPELPTREQWEAKTIEDAARGGPGAVQQEPSPLTALRHRWTSANRGTRLLSVFVAAVALAAVVMIAALGDESEEATPSLASEDGLPEDGPAPEQGCVDLWNNGDGNHISRIERFAEGGGEVLASVGYSAEFRDRCLVTVVVVDQITSPTFQFMESRGDVGGPFRELGYGRVTDFPESARQYNATVAPDGTLSLGF